MVSNEPRARRFSLNAKMNKTSQISGFYKLPIEERLKIVKEFSNLTDEEISLLQKSGSLEISQADKMIENVIGTFPLPLGIAVNFKINNKDYLIPMAIEEPSVVAAASNSAKMALPSGFSSVATEPIMIGQIQLMDVKNPTNTKKLILKNKAKILELANRQDSTLVKFGGGIKGIEVKVLKSFRGSIVLTHLLVDCRDAMGANAVNTMCESVAPFLEKLTGGRACLRIISNLAVYRLVKVKATFYKEALGGEKVVSSILDAYALATCDQFRATTHNKGVMNGITAVVLATGNDTRAVESGAHSYASYKRKYSPLTKFSKDKNGNLLGEIELPIAVGLVGGATKTHPIAKIAVKILGVKTAKELAEVIGAVGLAQNLAALRALATEGIQRGHMELHARNIAITAGAPSELVDKVAEQLIKERNISVARAKEILALQN